MRHTLFCVTAAAILAITSAYADLEEPHNPVKSFEQNRLSAIESSNELRDKQIYGIRTMQPSAWNTLLESRLKAIESKQNASGETAQAFDTAACKDLKASNSKANTLLCPTGQVIVGFSADNGKLSSARCCPLR